MLKFALVVLGFLALIGTAMAGQILVVAGKIELNNAAATQEPKILLPAYFYPGPLWTQIDSTLPAVAGSYVIMDPTTTGPGPSPDPNYVSAVNSARAAGLNVIGYIDTQNGSRSASAVETDVDNYKAWYGVNSIFLDEVSSSATKLSYYQGLANYIHLTAGAIVVLNPGTIPDQGYMSIGDIVVIFESDYTTYLTWSPPSWVTDYPSSKIANIVYNTPDETSMLNGISLAKARNAGYLYFNNDVSYSTLPAYWNQELAALVSIGGQIALASGGGSGGAPFILITPGGNVLTTPGGNILTGP